MGRICAGVGVMLAVWTLNTNTAASCSKACPATQKDAKGCCPVKSAPTPNGTGGTLAPLKLNPIRRALPKARCPEGSTLHAGRCVSIVECPAGFAFVQGKCRPVQEGMVYVEEGEFIRGSYKGDEDEKPPSRVWLDGYWIDTHEVTVGEYAACVKAGACTVPKESFGKYANWGSSGPRSERLRYPINGVSWSQAEAYCVWKGKRLPTEAEWEKAARGVDGRTYPWGEEKPSCRFAVMDDGVDGCGGKRTWDVGSKFEGASPYGVHDMAGNVWEWTADWYDANYYASADGSGPNPKGPVLRSKRVVRGGGWINDGDALRASFRFGFAPSDADFGLGFRCAGSAD